jgi:hypothetical protein
MALITLPLGLDQQEGWGTVPLPSAMTTLFHGVLSLIPAYREAYTQQEKQSAKKEDDDEEQVQQTEMDLILPEDRWRYLLAIMIPDIGALTSSFS